MVFDEMSEYDQLWSKLQKQGNFKMKYCDQHYVLFQAQNTVITSTLGFQYYTINLPVTTGWSSERIAEIKLKVNFADVPYSCHIDHCSHTS